MDAEISTVKYKWQIHGMLIPRNTRVISCPFSNLKNLNFDLSIGLGQDYRNLDIQVRKSDSRQGSAAIQIDLAKQNDNPTLIISDCFQTQKFSSSVFQNETSKCFNLVIRENVTEKKELNDWKDLCTFKFQNFLNQANPGIVPYPTECNHDYRIKNLIVYCTITWRGFTNSEVQKVSQVLQPFFKADAFSDVVLVVDNHKIPAHKIILSAHSSYFHAMFTSDMKESKENRVEIKNFTVDLITEMLEYFYTNKTKASENVDAALQMVPIADMYHIGSLKDICEATLLKNISLDNVLEILCTADDHNLTKLRNKTVIFMRNNKSQVVKIPEFENLFYDKPRIMFEFTYAMATL